MCVFKSLFHPKNLNIGVTRVVGKVGGQQYLLDTSQGTVYWLLTMQVSSVKMVGYWPSSSFFFFFLLVDGSKQSRYL